MRRVALALLCVVTVAVSALSVFAQPATSPDASPAMNLRAPLIPRDVLFGNPDRAQVRISPDGSKVSWLAPVEGVLNVWVAPAGDLSKAKPVTHDRKRGIMQHSWAYTSGHILYLQDDGGNENWNVHVVDLNQGQERNLTPNPEVNARIENISERFPEQILIGVNDRVPQLHDLYRVDLLTGERTLLVQNPGMLEGGMVAGFVTDDDFNVRYALTFNRDGSSTFHRAKPDGKAAAGGYQWEVAEKVPMEDAMGTSPVGFDKTGQVLYMTDSRGRNTSALTATDLRTGETKVLAEDPKTDVAGAVVHPTEKTVQAVAFNYERQRWQVLDPAVQGDFDYLTTVADGDFTVSARTLDDKTWIVAYILDAGPVRYYRYDRPAKKAEFLFTNRKALEGQPLVKMHPVVIRSRDGLDLVSYYSLPLEADPNQDGKPERPVPMVLNVHGGPWARDGWGLDPEHQWLANRGYAVLSVNFRGSTGLGKSFLNAANKEWAGKMHDDLIDAVEWAVKQGIAQKEKVAIMGGSYGGYATLVGLTFTPDAFAAGVDIVGPSSIVTLLQNPPPYWAPFMPQFATRVGDHTTDEGRAFLQSRSPLHFVEKIKKPLLIAQGANDPRVKRAEADQIVQAMQEKQIPVTYVIYPDEGHGFARPPNRMSFYAVTESFLAKHLGGRYEPIGDDFAGSTIQVPVGVEYLPGVDPKQLPATRP